MNGKQGRGALVSVLTMRMSSIHEYYITTWLRSYHVQVLPLQKYAIPLHPSTPSNSALTSPGPPAYPTRPAISPLLPLANSFHLFKTPPSTIFVPTPESPIPGAVLAVVCVADGGIR